MWGVRPASRRRVAEPSVGGGSRGSSSLDKGLLHRWTGLSCARRLEAVPL